MRAEEANFLQEKNMLGAIVVFVVVIAIVGTYMAVVHSFLRSSEEPADKQREARYRDVAPAARQEPQGRTQFAH